MKLFLFFTFAFSNRLEYLISCMDTLYISFLQVFRYLCFYCSYITWLLTADIYIPNDNLGEGGYWGKVCDLTFIPCNTCGEVKNPTSYSKVNKNTFNKWDKRANIRSQTLKIHDVIIFVCTHGQRFSCYLFVYIGWCATNINTNNMKYKTTRTILSLAQIAREGWPLNVLVIG